eukprot:5062928-Amphidinium_carterae.1
MPLAEAEIEFKPKMLNKFGSLQPHLVPLPLSTIREQEIKQETCLKERFIVQKLYRRGTACILIREEDYIYASVW